MFVIVTIILSHLQTNNSDETYLVKELNSFFTGKEE